MDADPMIDVQALSKSFGHFTAVDGVSFSVARGEVFGLLGPNGAGKSTCVRMLCGLLRSSAGTARVGGFDIDREPERVRESIGYMSQKFSLYRDLTVAENIAFFGGVYGLAGRRLKSRAESAITLAGLQGQEQRLAGELSGAHQQRLALGCAILHEPPILFLDEPTSGVDPVSRRRFWNLIRDLANRGVTVVVTTHFMDEAEFCARIGFVSAGRLIALDTPSNLKRNAVAEDIFEIALLRPGEVQEALLAPEGVTSVSHFGTRLHLFCGKGRHTAESLRRALAQGGVEVRSIAPVPATLEDVFVRLAGGQERRES